jgi:hypothetical protein
MPIIDVLSLGVAMNQPSERRTDDEPEPGLPRWLRLGAIAVALIVLVVVAVMLVGGGHTPPIRH